MFTFLQIDLMCDFEGKYFLFVCSGMLKKKTMSTLHHSREGRQKRVGRMYLNSEGKIYNKTSVRGISSFFVLDEFPQGIIGRKIQAIVLSERMLS